NHTDPTGQSPEDAWNWFNDNILSWEGMPYLDLALAIGGVALTIGTGGLAAPVAAATTAARAAIYATRTATALAAAGGVAAGVAATDQIWAQNTGKAFLSDNVRTAFDVAAFVGGVSGAASGAASGGRKAIQKFNSKFRTSNQVDKATNDHPSIASAVKKGKNSGTIDKEGGFFDQYDEANWAEVHKYQQSTGMHNAFSKGGPNVKKAQQAYGPDGVKTKVTEYAADTDEWGGYNPVSEKTVGASELNIPNKVLGMKGNDYHFTSLNGKGLGGKNPTIILYVDE
ncbi:hypothetical protein, partial [Streptomyces cyaneofuscatus]|uniref:hypothetical protein n=1 Tax=Streptomyces cyaneofuscatus TaxID=66883 RepID=UPI003669CC5B